MPHRQATETNEDLSECAKKGIAGELLSKANYEWFFSTLQTVELAWSWPYALFDFIPTCNGVVKPRKGDALLFFSLEPNAIPDTNSLHGGCPVIEGEKWSATKWIHVDSFSKNLANIGNCTDQNESCERWAALGECTKNPEYMVGSPELPGYCRRSCRMCWSLQSGYFHAKFR